MNLSVHYKEKLTSVFLFLHLDRIMATLHCSKSGYHFTARFIFVPLSPFHFMIFMVKAVFFDIDGTLVSFNTHCMSDSTVHALNLLREKGIKTFIATGRQFPAINNLGGMPFDGYVTMNGSFCFVGDYEVVRKQLIPQGDIEALIAYMQEYGEFPCFFLSEKDAFGNFFNDAVRKVFDQLNFPTPQILPLEAALGKDICQFVAFYNPQEEERLMSALSHCETARWSPYFSDILPKGSGKEKGIEAVLAHLGIQRSETMAFGDGGNDVSMLRYVHTGIAMGNAGEEVKRLADYVTTSVDEDGVWNALRHFGII